MASKILRIENKDIAVTRPDKLLFPDVSLSKWEYVLHMVRLAPYIIPYTRNRLLTVIRYPDGTEGKHFYQKNIPAYAPNWVRTARDGGTRYILLQDTATLAWLATQAALEFHTSFHFAGSGRPAELVFDLDPSVEGFAAVTEVALLLNQTLLSLGLTSMPKTSGATGLQVYVPIERHYSFRETRSFGHFLGRYLQEKHPRLITLERLKRHRGDKVYIDYLQHWYGKSIIAPYSPRARKGAPVSTPLRWKELERGFNPQESHLRNIHARLSETGDLFQLMKEDAARQSLDEILHAIRS